MTPHAFIAMPFGRKPAEDGTTIDFNRVHDELLRPALERAGCTPFRADMEVRAGSIHKDMFQELLMADLVLVDLSIDNPNVWYELGVRHALRARGVVLVQAADLRGKPAFDTVGERKVRYRLRDGAPDPGTLAADIEAIAEMVRQTLAAPAQRRVSPVYQWLPELPEPSWRQLLMDEDNEFGAAFAAWRSRVEVARQCQRPGDILLLADETPTQALWADAKREAGNCLLMLRQHGLALEQFEAVLAQDPEDAVSRRQRIVCLGRLGRHEAAHVAAQALTQARGADAQAWALAGRVEKQRWIARWRDGAAKSAAGHERASAELASLEDAIAPYHRAFIADPSAFYPGINSLTLHHLLRHLGGEVSQTVLDNLTGGVLWACLAAQKRQPRDYWARASYAELCLLCNGIDSVRREFRTAVAAADGNGFALDSTLQTLQVLRDLQWRPQETAAALEIVEHELQRVSAHAAAGSPPRQVILGAGHMVDAPGRPQPRFPSAKVGAAAAAFERALDELAAGPGDLAVTAGAAGGDLLFAEACLARGVRVQLMLPEPEPAFVQNSILPSDDGPAWRQRYFALKSRLAEPPRVMSEELGPGLPKQNRYARCNRWQLYTAMALGLDKLRFVCLWDGGGGDGPGGTRDLHDEVMRRTGRVHWIDSRQL